MIKKVDYYYSRKIFPKYFLGVTDKNNSIPLKEGEEIMEIRNINNLIKNIGNQDIHKVDSKKSDKSSGKTSVDNKVFRGDAVDISQEAQQALEIQKYTRMAKRLPDVREGEIQRVEQRLSGGFYDDPAVLKDTARNILK